jgi:muramoyltetrapeptide carboxypeptidase LdcA involved in peptidoglycan recycling
MSDIDVLHLSINTKTDLVVFNGSNAKAGRKFDLDDEYTWNSFQNRILDKSKTIQASSERVCIRDGIAE